MVDGIEWRDTWLSREGEAYGELFFKRATGEMDEMECSKAAANRVAQMSPNQTILDVGCGVGHYLVSLKKSIDQEFRYIGVDPTPSYVARARQAFDGCPEAEFVEADIFELPFADNSIDVVMCNNVLLHLPNIVKPLAELARVARHSILIRTLVGSTTFVIKHIDPALDGDEFDADESPRRYHYLNIYSEGYLRRLLSQMSKIATVKIEPDDEFDPSRLSDTRQSLGHAWDATKAVGRLQISEYIIQPWAWVTISMK